MKSFFKDRSKRGFVLLTAALCIVAMIGAIGLAVDIGRAFIARSELQVYTDSAALAATMELDGTSAGIARAQAQVAGNTNQWNFATSGFTGTAVTFGQTSTGPWYSNPPSPKGYLYANVIGQLNMPLYFIPTVQTLGPAGTSFLMLSSSGMNVAASSAGGQYNVTSLGSGLFPFSPYAHDASTGPDYGLVPGTWYTLRWSSNPKLDKNTCAGDNTQTMIDLASAGGGSERGYYADTSASAIRQDIENDKQDFTVAIGDTLNMTGGAKQTELDALINRVGQDSNSTAEDYEDYIAAGNGNGRRIVGAPINSGSPDYKVLQIGAFFIAPADAYSSGGNNAWCAEYLGAWVQGAKNKGASESGAYVVRLVK